MAAHIDVVRKWECSGETGLVCRRSSLSSFLLSCFLQRKTYPQKVCKREEEGGYSAPISIVLPNMGMMCNIVLASQQLRRALPKFLKVHIFLCGIYKLSGFRTIQCISRDRGKEIKEEGFFILNGRSLGCKIAGPIHLHGPWFCPDKIDHKTNETNSNIQILTK